LILRSKKQEAKRYVGSKVNTGTTSGAEALATADSIDEALAAALD
jgi:hypothetical protein